MPCFKITVAYDGTGYVGWQRQVNGVSIQGLLEDALRALDGRDVTVKGAGRTDAGVHALGQVAAFTIDRVLPGGALVRALNARLPDAIRVLSADEVPAAFHPRFGAREKTYRYRIWNGEVMSPFERRYAWHLVGALDVPAMQAAARLLEGRHDFTAFQAAGSATATGEREIMRSHVWKSFTTEDTEEEASSRPGLDLCVRRVLGGGELIWFELTGTGFLRRMVRTIVGTLVEIGRGRQRVDWIGRVLASRDRATAGPTAPPEGLFLVRVAYGDALAANP